MTADVSLEILANVQPEQVRAASALCARGVPDMDVALSVGITDEQLRILKTTNEFRGLSSDNVGERVQSALESDNKWDQVENTSLDGLLGMLRNERHLMEPTALIRMAQVANQARRRHGGADAGTVRANTERNGVTVNVVLPNAMLQQMNDRVREHRDGIVNLPYVGGVGSMADTVVDIAQFENQKLTLGDVESVLRVDVSKSHNYTGRIDETFMQAIRGTGIYGGDEDEDEDSEDER